VGKQQNSLKFLSGFLMPERAKGYVMIGKITVIDHRLLDISFFGYHHRVATHLAAEFAKEILDKAEAARQSGPRCRCGHLIDDHGLFNGDSHPDPENSNGVCGCVFGQDEARMNPPIPITYRDTPWICTCGAGGDKEAPDHAESCAVYCPF
jgi:hypothetical protein